jgi:hypothetical protein
MAATLLHLVDQYGHPVPPQVRLAVEAAYLWAEREYERFDRAVLAEMAEALAVSMCRHQDRIELPRRYAVAALAGKLQEWYRAHPAVEVMLEPEDLEQVIQAEPVPATSPDLNVLFAEIKAQLSERIDKFWSCWSRISDRKKSQRHLRLAISLRQRPSNAQETGWRRFSQKPEIKREKTTEP